MSMTAEKLLAAAMTCVVCGEEHKPRKMGNYTSWAGRDGHSYRTRLYQMTGYSNTAAVEALRQLARCAP
jgi:hypothetical protein